MADNRVTCITKNAQTHESITHLGGKDWYYTKQQVISFIESKTHTFYTLVGGNHATVGVVNGQSGKYLKTHADGKWNDNLLALPSCG
ncbi:MAG: DUF3892 domain-containing protein [Myxococcales bacterium]|nr:DUF3892 domain-containing protein [Myxococcales bacterium]